MVHPTFEIEATIPGEDDYRRDLCKPWAELLLTINRDGKNVQTLDLTRDAGEAIISTVGNVLHRWGGKSIIESIWEELDLAMDTLMTAVASDEDKGFALGMAMALAYMYNPVNPDVDQIRADAVERWESRQDDE